MSTEEIPQAPSCFSSEAGVCRQRTPLSQNSREGGDGEGGCSTMTMRDVSLRRVGSVVVSKLNYK